MPPHQDDPSIDDDARLWRRLPPEWIKTQEGERRPMSLAFTDRRSGEVSVHLAELTDLATICRDYPGLSVAEITAGFVRSIGCVVVRAPTDDDPSHALIYPSPSKGNAKGLARAAVWVHLAQEEQ